MYKRKILDENLDNYQERKDKLDALEQDIINTFINLRKKRRLTQQEMADQGNVIRETVARIENRVTSPQLNTLLKIIEPMGYTVKIVKLNKKKTKETDLVK